MLHPEGSRKQEACRRTCPCNCLLAGLAGDSTSADSRPIWADRLEKKRAELTTPAALSPPPKRRRANSQDPPGAHSLRHLRARKPETRRRSLTARRARSARSQWQRHAPYASAGATGARLEPRSHWLRRQRPDKAPRTTPPAQGAPGPSATSASPGCPHVRQPVRSPGHRGLSSRPRRQDRQPNHCPPSLPRAQRGGVGGSAPQVLRTWPHGGRDAGQDEGDTETPEGTAERERPHC